MDSTAMGTRMTISPLLRLFKSSRSEHAPVAFRNGAPLSFGRFLNDVRAVAASCDARPAALVCEDSYNFLVGLFGLLHAGATVIFPPGTQAASLSGLRDKFEVLVDDRAVEGANATSIDLKPLDATNPSLHFFTSGSTGIPKRVAKTLAIFDTELAILEGLWGGLAAGSPAFATVPHHHIYGMTFKLLWPFAAGRPFDTQTHNSWEALIAHSREFCRPCT
jgi:acyl-coenzyme A synthetase/AMP-(fatty) acid ligase